ncbi:MAG: hypothetical protein KVP17_002587 [Porospora cf. gigantea B]|uniref:uncharacterized protein n=1 Tax=Porospora cf. gigantea B TaxID=2853592 RepID=UPI003571C494|nr:MAG: hypothetical protein KVP17_002587 [Porospora cf. gigantea B]
MASSGCIHQKKLARIESELGRLKELGTAQTGIEHVLTLVHQPIIAAEVCEGSFCDRLLATRDSYWVQRLSSELMLQREQHDVRKETTSNQRQLPKECESTNAKLEEVTRLLRKSMSDLSDERLENERLRNELHAGRQMVSRMATMVSDTKGPST